MNALETIKKGLADLVAETRRRWTRAGERHGDGDSPSGAESLAPARADIYESPAGVSIFVDLPGVKHKGLRIEARDDRLEIKALRDDRETARRLSGFVPDGYEASFRLNPSLDAEKIDAELRDGVLRVIIPRAEGSKPRRIPVKSQT